jgi:16S rRNA processing protein RimM
VVGRIIRPHGLRGELSVEVRTDEPGQRYAAGSVLDTDPSSAGPLTVTSSRWHSGRLLVNFAEVADRTEAESLRGVWLTVDASEVTLPDDPDEFHDYQLTGLTVVTVSGELVGTVSDVLHYGQALLSVTPAAGTPRQAEVLVPFVAAIAVEVDLAAGKLVIDPPPGLLDLAPAATGREPRDVRTDPGRAPAGPDDVGPGSDDVHAGRGGGDSSPGVAGPAPGGVAVDSGGAGPGGVGAGPAGAGGGGGESSPGVAGPAPGGVAVDSGGAGPGGVGAGLAGAGRGGGGGGSSPGVAGSPSGGAAADLGGAGPGGAGPTDDRHRPGGRRAD